MTSLPLMYSTAILDQVNLFHSDTTAKKGKPWSLPYYLRGLTRVKCPGIARGGWAVTGTLPAQLPIAD